MPTVHMVRSWKKLAEKSKMPLSKFVSDHVENTEMSSCLGILIHDKSEKHN